MGYKERSWCYSSVKCIDGVCTNTLCYRNFTEDEHKKAVQWWGDANFPIVFTEMRTNKCGYKND